MAASIFSASLTDAAKWAPAPVRIHRVYVHAHDHHGQHTHGDGSDTGHVHDEEQPVTGDEKSYGPTGGHSHGSGGGHGHDETTGAGAKFDHVVFSNKTRADHDDDDDDEDVEKQTPIDPYASHGHSHSGGPHGHSHGGAHGHAHFNRDACNRLFRLTWEQRGIMIWGLLSLVASAAINTALPIAMGYIIDAPDEDTLWGYVRVIAGVLVGGAFFSFIRSTAFAYAGEQLVRSLRQRLFQSIITQDLGFFDKTRTGELINRLSADTTLIQTAATLTLATGLRFLCQVLGGVAVLFYLSWKLTLVMVIPLVVLGGVAFFMSRKVRSLSTRMQTALAQSTTVAEEAISGVRHIRSFGKEEQEKARYADTTDVNFRLGKRLAFAYGIFQGGAELAAYVSIVLVITYGSILTLHDQLSKGDLTAYLLYEVVVAHALGAFSGNLTDFVRAVGAAERVFELLDRQPQINITGGTKLARVEGLIRFRNVVFRYPSRPNSAVLRGVDLTLEPGKLIALVGPSGGGKTTIGQLILRFYDPTTGEVTLDGTPLSELDPRWLREQIGFVAQDPVLFAASVRDNIGYGMDNVEQYAVERAAVAAQAHEFIMKLPNGYDTMVGERGVLLSGGQKQRIAIARALIKNPPILILDEATSALDAENESLVQKALDQAMIGRTVLVIAHRLSTVRKSNRVCVLVEGSVVESGTHDQLFGLKTSVYHRLVIRQMQANASLELAEAPAVVAAAVAGKAQK